MDREDSYGWSVFLVKYETAFAGDILTASSKEKIHKQTKYRAASVSIFLFF